MTEKINVNNNENGYKRFDLRRNKDWAIVDNENEIAPILVDMTPTDDGSESGYADRVGVVNFLNRLNNKNNDFNLSVFDFLVSIERNVIILEKIMREIDYIGRCNFEHSEEFRNRREEQFLIEIQNHYDNLFEDTYKNIRDAKKELEL